MLITESINTAIDSIRSNALRSILTTLAIIIGTAAVITMVAMGSSAQRAIDESITKLGARTIYVYPGWSRSGSSSDRKRTLDIKDADALIEDNEINWKIAPEIRGSRLVKLENESVSLEVIGSTENFFDIRGYELDEGVLFNERQDLSRKRVVVLGSSVPKELKTTKENLLGNEISIAGVNFKVIGFIESQGSNGWRNPDEQVYTPLYTASDRIFGRDTINSINVDFSTEYRVEDVMIAIE